MNSEILAYDIETDGFLEDLTKIHCINIYSTKTHKHTRYDQISNPIEEGVIRLAQSDVAGHNVIGFDEPALRKLYPWFPTYWKEDRKVIDTRVWASCTYPNIKDIDFGLYRKGRIPASLIGKQTLESWGYRLGILKGEFAKETDWKEWSPEMSDYCEQDVLVTLKLLDRLEQSDTSWEQIQLEMDVFEILNRQMRKGVLFNVRAAEELYTNLNAKREKLREQLQEDFPPFYKRKGRCVEPKRTQNKYTKAGNLTKNYIGRVAGAEYQPIELVEFNPASTAHVARMLMSKFEWIPKEFADAEAVPAELQVHYDRLGVMEETTPKIDEEIVSRLDVPELAPLKNFLTLNKRCGQIAEGKQAWLRCYNEDTNRIHGVINQFGAVTGRCTHFKPNLAQVPAGYSPYGSECRSLFIVPPGFKLIGCDADGLEARCLAHYLAPYDGGAYIKVLLEGNKADGTDGHSLNRNRLGFTGKNGRDEAKTWFYAFLYGAGNKLLGINAIVNEAYADYKGDPAKLGAKLRAKFLNAFPGLKKLTEAVKKAAKRGWLKGLDGRRIPIRSQHAALNSLLQSAGAVIMKKALVLADNTLRHTDYHPGTDYEFVLNVHDEYQVECHEGFTQKVGKILKQAIVRAGEHFNFRCPLDADYDIGDNWSQTH